MANYNLGTARGAIEIDASGAVKGSKTAGDAVEQVGTKYGNAARSAGAAGGVLTGAAAVIGGAFAAAVVSAANFEAKISGIGAVSGATAPQLEQIRQKALDLGKTTSFSAGEAAEAIEELVKAGLPLADVLAGAADAAVALAAAGGVSMPEAAEQISNAMNQFGIAAKDVGGVADIIAGAANASAISVGDFGQSLKQVGAVANLTGVSFEDTATAIALLGQAGIKGSDAGTSLKTMLSNLQPTTDKQTALFKKLGLITADGANQFFTAEGKLKSLAEVSQIMQNSLKGQTDQQKALALETLFGSDAIRAAAILTKEGASGFNEMSGAMGKVTAEAVALERLDNVKGKFEELKGSLETAAITIGTLLLPAVQKIIEFFTGLINKFLELSPSTQKIILAVVGITAAIVGVIGVILTVVAVIGAFMAALAPVAAAIGIGVGALAGIVAVVPIVIAAIVLLAILIVKNWDTIKEKTVAVFNAIKDFLVGVWDSIKGALSTAFEAIKSAAESVFNAVKDFFSTVFDAIKGIITTVTEAIRAVFDAWWATVTLIFTTALNAIKALWSAIWSTFGPLIKAILDLIVAIFNLWWTVVKGIFLLALEGLKLVVTTAFNAIKTVIESILNGIKIIIETVWNAIKPFITAAVNAIKTAIETGFNAAKTVVTTVFNAIKNAIETVWNAIKPFIVAAVANVLASISKLKEIVAKVAGFFGDMFNAVKTKVGELITFAGGIAGKVLGAIGNLGRLLFGKGQDIIQGLIDGITSMISKVTGAIESVTSKISAFLPGSPVKEGPLKVLNRGYAGGEIMRMLANGMGSELPAIQGLLGNVSATIATGVTPTVPAGYTRPLPAFPAAGPSYNIDRVEIPARDLEEMRGVQDFFDRIQQEGRRRTAGAGVGR